MKRLLIVVFVGFACNATPSDPLVGDDAQVAVADAAVDAGRVTADASLVDGGDQTRDSGLVADGGMDSPRPIPRRMCAGDSHTCAIDAVGDIQCWDLTGSVFWSGGVETYVDVACGAGHACAVRGDGTVTCRGANDSGQGEAPLEDHFVQVAAGDRFSCALDLDGQVSCWGAPPMLGPGAFREVAAGAEHVCLIAINGNVECHGANDENQSSPPPGPLMRLDLGGNTSCGIGPLGGVNCWGHQRSSLGGNLGAAVGDDHVCSLHDRGTTSCEGANDRGQSSLTGTFVEITGGARHTCGRRPDGAVACFGSVVP